MERRLQRATTGTLEAANEQSRRLESLRRALDQSPAGKADWRSTVRELEKRNRDILRAAATGYSRRGTNVPVSIARPWNSLYPRNGCRWQSQPAPSRVSVPDREARN
jgi:hypothetical protein